ncbi:MAG: hypothetical protein AAF357_07065 [Verrucomicrobiota bacterium]
MKHHRCALIWTTTAGILFGVAMYFSFGHGFLIMGMYLILPAFVFTTSISWITVLAAFLFSQKKPDQSLIAFASFSSYLALACSVAMLTNLGVGSLMLR